MGPTTTEMREVLALITFALLFWIGWDQSYRDHVTNVLTGRPPSEKRAVPQPAATPIETVNVSTTSSSGRDNSWMWQKSKLDNPQTPARHGR